MEKDQVGSSEHRAHRYLRQADPPSTEPRRFRRRSVEQGRRSAARPRTGHGPAQGDRRKATGSGMPSRVRETSNPLRARVGAAARTLWSCRPRAGLGSGPMPPGISRSSAAASETRPWVRRRSWPAADPSARRMSGDEPGILMPDPGRTYAGVGSSPTSVAAARGPTAFTHRTNRS